MRAFFKRLTAPLPEPKKTPPALDWWLLGLLSLLAVYAENRIFSYQPTISSDDAAISLIQESLKFFLCAKHAPGLIYQCFGEYPPLIFALSSLAYGLAGFSPQLGAFTSLLFFPLLIFALYQSAYLLGGRLTGWLAVLLLLMNPRLLFWGKYYTLNLPEAAWLSTCLAFLLLSREFKKPLFAWLFGLSLGLGLLSKYMAIEIFTPLLLTGTVLIARSFPEPKKQAAVWGALLASGLGAAACLWGAQAGGGGLFLKTHYWLWQIGGLFLAGWLSYRLLKGREAKPLANFTLALFLGLALALPWYLSDLGTLLGLLQSHPHAYSATEAYLENPAKLFLLYAFYLFPAAPLFLGAGLIFCLFHFREFRFRLILLSAPGGFLLLSWLGIGSDYRYFLALIPLLILTAVSWVSQLPKPWQTGLVVLSLGWFLLNLEAVDLNCRYLPPDSPKLGFSRTVLDLSRIPADFLDAHKNYPELNFRDLVLIGLEAPECKAIASALRQTPPVEERRLVFINQVNRLVVENAQLETFLWAQDGFTGGDLSPSRLSRLTILEFRKPFPLIEFPTPHRQRLQDFAAYRFPEKPDHLLIAVQDPGDFPVWETRAREKGFDLRLLEEFRLSRRNWEKYTDFTLRLYRL